MTPLMMLALTLPPSAAWFMVRLVDLYAAENHKLGEKQEERVRALEERIETVSQLVGWHEHHEAELKKLSEQVTSLTERVYRQ